MRTKIKIHPKAALFPMLSKEELNELAADIKTNGLREPIVVDKDGLLVDGRNRLAACEIAGVEPTVIDLNGTDTEAFIISRNLARRHMNPGQRATVVAMMYPEADEKGGRGKTSVVRRVFPMVSDTSLFRARKVLRFAPDLAASVLNNSLSLEEAYQKAKEREQFAESDEAKINLLKNEARDLAELVIEERMKVDEALAAFQDRKRKTREAIEEAKMAAETGMSRFLADVATILIGSTLTQEKLLDKKKLEAVIKAAHQLESVIK
jgi:hypothetical protein